MKWWQVVLVLVCAAGGAFVGSVAATAVAEVTREEARTRASKLTVVKS